MRQKGSVLALATALAAMSLLTACDEQEQDRILRYEKGTYLGKPDTPLTEEQIEDLRLRARRQAGK